MSTWWQVYVNHTVFGFKTEPNEDGDIYIIDHPEKLWKLTPLEYYKKWLIKNNAQVWKIADVQN